MADGPAGFTQDYTCPALLRVPLRFTSLRIRNSHALWPDFPDRSSQDVSCDLAALQPRRGLNPRGLGSSPFARHYWGNHCCFLFLRVLRCFSSPRLPPASAGWQSFRLPGCPIRKSADQRPFAPTRGLSQLVTSFIACKSLGIHRTPFPAFSPWHGNRSADAMPEYTESVLSSTFSFACVCALSHITTVPISGTRCVENNGFEPLTPCLQSRCSSQLS